MPNIKEIKAPFASKGDRADFPYNPTLEGFLSWLSGYTARYAMKPEENGLYIERLEFNQLMYLITQYMIDLKNSSATGVDLNKKLDKDIYYADKPNFVTINTQQTINALKNFAVCPRTGVNPTNPSDLVRLAYFQANAGIGSNQTWKDVTKQRRQGVTYYNTTGKPIMVCVTSTAGCVGYRGCDFYINGVKIIRNASTEWECRAGNASITAIVPNGASYKAGLIYPSLELWTELR